MHHGQKNGNPHKWEAMTCKPAIRFINEGCLKLPSMFVVESQITESQRSEAVLNHNLFCLKKIGFVEEIRLNRDPDIQLGKRKIY